MDKDSNKIILEELKNFKKELQKKYKIEKIILFGSRARGDYLHNSDVDVIIISDDFKGTKIRDRSSEFLKYWNILPDLEAIGYTTKEFKEKLKEIGLVKQANKEGIEI